MKLFSYSTQLSTKFILLINVQMPTTVGILIFISMVNTPDRLNTRNFFIYLYLVFISSLKFLTHVKLSMKFFYNHRARQVIDNKTTMCNRYSCISDLNQTYTVNSTKTIFFLTLDF